MEPLHAVLRSVRLRSTVASVAHLSGRWGIQTAGFPRTVVFHGVLRGRCLIRLDGSSRTEVPIETGDIAFLARGSAHVLFSQDGAPVVPLEEVPIKLLGGVPLIEYGTKGDETRIVCGKCTLDHPAAHSVLELLPALIKSRPGDDRRRRWVMATLALLEEEVLEERGGSLASLTDALFVRIVADVAEEGATSRGILAAARDPHIGKALALIHRDPSGAFTTSALGAKVGMGRTRFFDRFTELVGEPPAKYIARWRILSAADLLKDVRLSTQQIAEKVGYANEDALARAFKRHMGQRLGEYRRRLGSATNVA